HARESGLRPRGHEGTGDHARRYAHRGAACGRRLPNPRRDPDPRRHARTQQRTEEPMTLPTDPAAPPIRVAIVDDQQLVRAGFALVINSQPDMEVVLEAGDGAQALRLLTGREVDVVLMDIRMPQMDGLAATATLTDPAHTPPGDTPPRVVILTTFDLDEYALAAIKAGASGFLLKDAPPEDMLAAIRTIHRGDAVIAPSTTRRLIEQLAERLPADEQASPQILDTLTDREREVL